MVFEPSDADRFDEHLAGPFRVGTEFYVGLVSVKVEHHFQRRRLSERSQQRASVEYFDALFG